MTDTARKLATIVALDVAGYSARTEADEARTTAEVAALRKVIETIAAKYGGRVFNTAGDGFMLEFGSSLAAVEAAFELAETCVPKVRVGVHLGDVVVQPNGDLLGHGVNVAARLMARSDPGGALVSGAVRQSIRGPVAERLQSQGMLKLDKMAETIEAFALAAVSSAVAAQLSESSEPVLAVLPFDNLSSDAEMAFFSDGVSEDILGRIARGAGLKVIGRISSFQFRGADKAKAAQTLGATHVLDGSIRRAGNKVRIAAHLTEAASRSTLWSDKFDRGLEDIFAVQDEISEAIAQALNTTFFHTKTAAIDPAIYDLYLKARGGGANMFFPPAESIATLEAITRIAPAFAPAWGALAVGRAAQARQKTFPERANLRPEIEQIAQTCLDLDPQNMLAMHARLLVLNPFGDFVTTAAIIKQAGKAATSVHLNLFLSVFYESVGQTRDAIKAALALRELDKQNDRDTLAVGLPLWRAGRYAEGIAAMEEALERWPDTYDIAASLIIAYAVAGNWAAVDRMVEPQRLAKYSLRELIGVVNLARTMRDPTPESRLRWLDSLRRIVDETGHIEAGFAMVFAARFGFVDEIYALLERSKLGPTGGPRDQLGYLAYTTTPLFMTAFPELRTDPRFVKLCARLGLVEYWLQTQNWPDCAEVVPYDFRAECEKHRDFPKDKFFQ